MVLFIISMNINDVNLKKLKEPLGATLSIYCSKLGVSFQNIEDFKLTPEKPNSARIVVPVNYYKTSVGEIYVIAFVKGDGTGDESTYKINDLIIPSEYYHVDKTARVIPRAKNVISETEFKTPMISEAFMPLFSIAPDNHVALFAASLDELTVDDNKIVPVGRLGLSNENYSKALKGELEVIPKIYTTVVTFAGKSIGDPHSVYYSRDIDDAVQIVGFLGVKTINTAIYFNFFNWSLPSKK
jgi:hypothetical protein